MEINSSQFVPILRNPSDFFVTNLPFLFLQVPGHLAKPLTTAHKLMYLYLCSLLFKTQQTTKTVRFMKC